MRIRMDVEYDGTNYCGWQRQKNGMAVQQVLEEALSRLVKQRIVIHGASRTDAGVHALRTTCHFDAQTGIPPEKLCYALNFLLPRDIRIKRTCETGANFHARFDARAKWYRYRVFNHTHGSALFARLCWHVPYALDINRMQRSLTCLTGTHDFAAFMASGSAVKHTVRTLHVVQLTQRNEFLTMDVLGDGFLYNMVRIIAGTLVDIGRGHCEQSTFSNMLTRTDRLVGGVTAPPQGLMLMRVLYDDDGELESWAREMSQTPF